MDVIQQLQELGFRRNDAAIYLELLKARSATPAQIAQHLGFSRSYAYDALMRLEAQGVVSCSTTDEQRAYAPISPKALVELAQQRAQSFASLLPALAALSKPQEGLHVEVHKGKYVYRTLLLDILEKLTKGETVLIFGIDDARLMEDEWVEKRLRLYFDKARKLGIRERAIVSKDNVPPPGAMTEYRTLPASLFDGVAYEVYSDTLALFLRGNPDHLLLVRSAQIANSYRSQFAALWQRASPIKRK